MDANDLREKLVTACEAECLPPALANVLVYFAVLMTAMVEERIRAERSRAEEPPANG